MQPALAVDEPIVAPSDLRAMDVEVPDHGTAPLLDSPNALERYLAAKLNRPEDVVFLRVALFASAVVLPAVASLYALEAVGALRWWIAPFYWAAVFPVFADRIGLTIHCLIHRRLFKREHSWLEQYIPGFLCVFFGHTPHTFYIHHMGMHHAESNMWDDTSSTLTYERDNFGHFLQYWLRFLFVGILDLLAYNWRKGRKKLFRLLILVEGGYILAVGTLFVLSPVATTIVFLVPVFLMRFFMMAGNWGQHALVCPDEPDNEYRKSVNLIHARHNRRCFNDGYHIVHHIHPGLHFTEMPASFENNLATYVEQDAIVFSGLKGNQVLWFLLMTRNYDRLAQHYVHLGGKRRTHDEVKALLKYRTRPVTRPAAA